MENNLSIRSRILLLGAGCLLLGLSPLKAAPKLVQVRLANGETRQALPGTLLVRFKDNATASRSSVFSNFNTRSTHRLPQLNADVLTVPAGETMESFMRRLERDPNVAYVQPNLIYKKLATTPNDPQLPNQYSLKAGYMDVVDAWDVSQGSPTVVVAVVDSGVTLTHPDLANRLWDNPAPDPASNSGAHGTRIEIIWEPGTACTDTTSVGPNQCASTDPTDDDSVHHGTHVAGLIAAESNNGQAIAGVANNARIMAVKVLNSDGNGSEESIVTGILWAVDHGAQIINMSLGGPDRSDLMADAVKYAVDHDVVVVAAAGNSGPNCSVMFPAAYDGVIGVGASDQNNQLAYFSCSGANLDVVAPGVNIVSLNNVGTSVLDGTSFSSPLVAGVAALIRSVNPQLTMADVSRYIAFYATDLGAPGKDGTFGFGLVNAAASVQAAIGNTSFITNPANPNETFPYPNPFNPKTDQTMHISIPANLVSPDFKITIYDIAGEKVKTLDNINTWDGRNESGSTVASGLYLYVIDTSKGTTKSKLTVLK